MSAEPADGAARAAVDPAVAAAPGNAAAAGNRDASDLAAKLASGPPAVLFLVALVVMIVVIGIVRARRRAVAPATAGASA